MSSTIGGGFGAFGVLSSLPNSISSTTSTPAGSNSSAASNTATPTASGALPVLSADPPSLLLTLPAQSNTLQATASSADNGVTQLNLPNGGRLMVQLNSPPPDGAQVSLQWSGDGGTPALRLLTIDGTPVAPPQDTQTQTSSRMKDSIAQSLQARIAKTIDDTLNGLAATVVGSSDPGLQPGQPVIVQILGDGSTTDSHSSSNTQNSNPSSASFAASPDAATPENTTIAADAAAASPSESAPAAPPAASAARLAPGMPGRTDSPPPSSPAALPFQDRVWPATVAPNTQSGQSLLQLPFGLLLLTDPFAIFAGEKLQVRLRPLTPATDAAAGDDLAADLPSARPTPDEAGAQATTSPAAPRPAPAGQSATPAGATGRQPPPNLSSPETGKNAPPSPPPSATISAGQPGGQPEKTERSAINSSTGTLPPRTTQPAPGSSGIATPNDPAGPVPATSLLRRFSPPVPLVLQNYRPASLPVALPRDKALLAVVTQTQGRTVWLSLPGGFSLQTRLPDVCPMGAQLTLLWTQLAGSDHPRLLLEGLAPPVPTVSTASLPAELTGLVDSGTAGGWPAGSQARLQILGQLPETPAPAGQPDDPEHFTGLLLAGPQPGSQMLQTRFGTVQLTDPLPLEPPAKLLLHLSGLTAALSGSSPALLPPAATDSPNPLLNRLKDLARWPLLGTLLEDLAGQHPELAERLSNAVPVTGAALGQKLLALTAAMLKSDARLLLGERLSADLDKTLGKDPLTAAGKTFSQWQGPVRIPGDSGQWHSMMLPVLADGQISNLRLTLRQPDPEEERARRRGDDSASGESRFLLDMDLTRLGALQLEGRMAKKLRRFDLYLRSQQPLPDDLCQDIRAIFTRSLSGLNMTGEALFQRHTAFVIPQPATDGTSGRGILA